MHRYNQLMKVKEYPGVVDWPPQPGGPYNRGQAFPVDQKVLITQIFPVVNQFVTFTCEFQNEQHSFDLQLKDKAVAEEFARFLKRHVGKTLEKFGEFRLDV